MKKLIIRDGACIGCGACIAVDPEHFDFNDDGLASVILTENLETSALQNAVGSCPTGAIVLDENTDCECENCECEDCNCGQ